jgi:hypothetical protein
MGARTTAATGVTGFECSGATDGLGQKSREGKLELSDREIPQSYRPPTTRDWQEVAETATHPTLWHVTSCQHKRWTEYCTSKM